MIPSLDDDEKNYPIYKRLLILFSRSLGYWLHSREVEILMFIPVFLGLLILIGSGWIRTTILGGNVPTNYEQILLGAVFIIFSLGGFAPIIKRKFPGAFRLYIEGKLAIVLGILWCLIFVALAIFVIRS